MSLTPAVASSRYEAQQAERKHMQEMIDKYDPSKVRVRVRVRVRVALTLPNPNPNPSPSPNPNQAELDLSRSEELVRAITG